MDNYSLVNMPLLTTNSLLLASPRSKKVKNLNKRGGLNKRIGSNIHPNNRNFFLKILNGHVHLLDTSELRVGRIFFNM